MKGHRGVLIALLVGLFAAGCHGPPSRPVVGSNEPGLALPGDSGVTVVEAPPTRAVTFADRHPLLSKPRQYYENAGSSNRAAKVASATLIGVPAGIVGELKQIVVGRPPDPSAGAITSPPAALEAGP